MKDSTMMSAAEFFGDVEKPETPVRKGRSRGKKSSAKDLFAELKVKMVMRIYGVSRKRALAIIAGRTGEKMQPERGNEPTRKDDGGVMSAEDFFGLHG